MDNDITLRVYESLPKYHYCQQFIFLSQKSSTALEMEVKAAFVSSGKCGRQSPLLSGCSGSFSVTFAGDTLKKVGRCVSAHIDHTMRRYSHKWRAHIHYLFFFSTN